MNNFQSTDYTSDKDDEKRYTNSEQIEFPSSLTKDSNSIEKESDNKSSKDIAKKCTNKKEKVAEKVEGSILLKSTLLRISSTTTKRMMTINT